MCRAFFFLLFVPLFICSCSAFKHADNNSQNISISHSEVYCWINLMPGAPPSFHLTGNILIKNKEAFDIQEIKLREITVLQDNNAVYKFVPVFESIEKGTPGRLNKKEEREFRFGVKTGLKISPELDSTKSLDAKLDFSFDEKIFFYIINDIEIEKAY